MTKLNEAIGDEIDETYDLIPMDKDDEAYFLKEIRKFGSSLRVSFLDKEHKIIISSSFKRWLIAKTNYGRTFDLFVMSGKSIYPSNIGAPKEEVVEVIKKALQFRDIFTY